MAAEEEEYPRRSDGGGTIPPGIVDPAGEVTVRGEDGIEEAQEGGVGVGRFRGFSRCVGGGSEALDPIQGAAAANPSNYVLLSVGGKVGADKNGGGGGGAQMVSGAVEGPYRIRVTT